MNFRYKRISEGSENMNPADQVGKTPLHYAAKNGHLPVCKYIIQNSKEKNPKDKEGKTPLDLAAENGELGLVYLMYKIITNQYIEGEENVVKFGESLFTNIKTKFFYFEERRELLHWAAANGNLNVCQLIIDNPIMCNKNPKDKHDLTPLHLAARNGHLAVCKLILQNTYSLGENQGRTPLHEAAKSGHEDIFNEIVNFLTGRNVQNKNPQDANGFTPLHLAVTNGHHNICKLIYAIGKFFR